MSDQYKILISAASTPAAYTLIKHLKSLGYYIIGIDSNIDTYEIGNLICDEFYISPSAFQPEYIIFISKIISDVDVFLPFIDEELMVLSSNKLPLNISKKIIASESETLKVCLNKKIFDSYCKDNNILVPSLDVNSRIICKPITGRGGKGIIFVDNFNINKILMRDEDYICQNFIDGKEYTVDCLFDTCGNLIESVQRERMTSSGVSTIGLIDHEESIELFILEIARKFKFYGLVNIQVIVAKGLIYLIEINPRISGSIIFSIISGCDLVDSALKQHLNIKFNIYKDKEKYPIKIFRYYNEYKY